MKDSEITILVFVLLFLIAFIVFIIMLVSTVLDVKKTTKQKIELMSLNLPSNIIIPNGWFCYQCGQDYLTFLWYIELMNIDDLRKEVSSPRSILIENGENFEEALNEAVKQIEII